VVVVTGRLIDLATNFLYVAVDIGVLACKCGCRLSMRLAGVGFVPGGDGQLHQKQAVIGVVCPETTWLKYVWLSGGL
jgi:hypothetical protein